MIGVDQMMDIRDLNRQGHSIRAIARLTGLSRNTIRCVLRGEHSLKRKGSPRGSKLDPFKDYVRRRRAEFSLSAVRLLAEIRLMGFQGSIVILRRFLATLKDEDRRERKLTVRFETPPGEQAQADWGHVGHLQDAQERTRPVYVFTFVLSFSRMLFVRFTTSMNLETLIDCHQRAFDYLGGWPRQILYDNMKQVRLGPGRWNPAFLDFANHHGFTPKTHRPYRPRTKGKVERAVEYVKNSFVLGRQFADLDELNAQAISWLEATANPREHATTGRRPMDLLAQENLTSTGTVPAYRYVDSVGRTANFEAMVLYQGNRYSVPPTYAGKPVQVSALGGQVVIRVGDTVIAEHTEAVGLGRCVVNREHVAELWKFTNEQIQKPPRCGLPLVAMNPVQRVDLNFYEEVTT